MNSYTLQKTENKNKYEKILNNSIIEFEKYFNIKLNSKPCLFFLNSRKKFDDVCGRETESWVTGYNIQNLLFMMEESVYEKESSKKLDIKNYPLTIKHELCHMFFHQLTWKSKPVWLNEGLSLYLSGQIKFRTKPEHFSDFLLFYEKNSIEDKTVYKEAGFVIEKLINKFGKDKLLEIINSLRKINNDDQFKAEFKQIYGFDLNYDNINKL